MQLFAPRQTECSQLCPPPHLKKFPPQQLSLMSTCEMSHRRRLTEEKQESVLLLSEEHVGTPITSRPQSRSLKVALISISISPMDQSIIVKGVTEALWL